MSVRVIAPCLRNGFPFAIPTLAEDGLPFTQWDGSTLYSPNSNGSGAVPSKSSSELIRVYGDGSQYCVKFTLAQLAEWYWRVETTRLTFEGLPHTYDLAASASAEGGDFGPKPQPTYQDPDPAAPWVNTSASDSTNPVVLDATALLGADYASYASQADGQMLDRGQYVRQYYDATAGVWTTALIDQDESSQVIAYRARWLKPGTDLTSRAWSDGMPGQTGYFDFLAKGTCVATTNYSDEGHTASIGGTSANTSASIGIFLEVCAQAPVAGVNPFIQSGPDEYWWSPLSFGLVTGTALAEADENVYVAKNTSKDGGLQRQLTWTIRTASQANIGDSPGAYFPVIVRLASGDVTGTMYGTFSASTVDTPSGDSSVTPTVSVAGTDYFVPTVVIEPVRWWEYSGLYDPATGKTT